MLDFVYLCEPKERCGQSEDQFLLCIPDIDPERLIGQANKLPRQ